FPTRRSSDLIGAHLRRFRRRQRREAAAAALGWQQSLRGGAIHAARPVEGGRPGLRLAVRRLAETPTRTLQERLQHGGVPSMSMAVLASAFPAVDHLAEPPRPGRHLIAGIRLDPGPRLPL